MAIHSPRGILPLGVIVAWDKSATGVPALADQGRDDLVECNGQTISDVESPMNGRVVQDLNGTTGSQCRRFLRGNATSGGIDAGVCATCSVGHNARAATCALGAVYGFVDVSHAHVIKNPQCNYADTVWVKRIK